MWSKNTVLHNFAIGNTISCSSDNLENLVPNLMEKSEEPINWFKPNEMIINPDEFQAIINDRKRQSNKSTEIKINGKIIKSDKTVKNY